MAALGCFISRLGERALPFFKIMKQSDTFKWTPEAAAAFEDLKKYLTSPPVKVVPRPLEHLLIYLAATPQTASAALVVEREELIPAKESTASPSPKPPDEGKAPSALTKAALPDKENHSIISREPPRGGGV
jgi:hypothetical protein